MCLWVLKFCFVSCFCINIVTTRNFVNVASKCFDTFFSAFGLNWNIAKMSFNVTCSEKTVDIALKEICAQYYYFSAFKILRPYLIWQEYIIFLRLCLKNIGKVCWFPYHFLWRYYTSFLSIFYCLFLFFSAFYLNQFWHGPRTIWKKLTDIWNKSKKRGLDVSQNIQVELAQKIILNKGWQCLRYLWELSGWIQISFDIDPSFLFFYHPWSYPRQHAPFYFCWQQGLEDIKALCLCWRRYYW